VYGIYYKQGAHNCRIEVEIVDHSIPNSTQFKNFGSMKQITMKQSEINLKDSSG
jgi:hypothetical protein